MIILIVLCFFCKQKTAYEMRISDWSSDVCSSDLSGRRGPRYRREHEYRGVLRRQSELQSAAFVRTQIGICGSASKFSGDARNLPIVRHAPRQRDRKSVV